MANGDAERQLRSYRKKIDEHLRRVFVLAAAEVQRSVVESSELTGAPGQPVDTGNLRSSWVGEFTSDFSWQLTTNVEYARYVEDNVNNVVYKNHGPHSMKMTVANFHRIAEHAVSRVKRQS